MMDDIEDWIAVPEAPDAEAPFGSPLSVQSPQAPQPKFTFRPSDFVALNYFQCARQLRLAAATRGSGPIATALGGDEADLVRRAVDASAAPRGAFGSRTTSRGEEFERRVWAEVCAFGATAAVECTDPPLLPEGADPTAAARGAFVHLLRGIMAGLTVQGGTAAYVFQSVLVAPPELEALLFSSAPTARLSRMKPDVLHVALDAARNTATISVIDVKSSSHMKDGHRWQIGTYGLVLHALVDAYAMDPELTDILTRTAGATPLRLVIGDTAAVWLPRTEEQFYLAAPNSPTAAPNPPAAAIDASASIGGHADRSLMVREQRFPLTRAMDETRMILAELTPLVVARNAAAVPWRLRRACAQCSFYQVCRADAALAVLSAPDDAAAAARAVEVELLPPLQSASALNTDPVLAILDRATDAVPHQPRGDAAPSDGLACARILATQRAITSAAPVPLCPPAEVKPSVKGSSPSSDALPMRHVALQQNRGSRLLPLLEAACVPGREERVILALALAVDPYSGRLPAAVYHVARGAHGKFAPARSVCVVDTHGRAPPTQEGNLEVCQGDVAAHLLQLLRTLRPDAIVTPGGVAGRRVLDLVVRSHEGAALPSPFAFRVPRVVALDEAIAAHVALPVAGRPTFADAARHLAGVTLPTTWNWDDELLAVGLSENAGRPVSRQMEVAVAAAGAVYDTLYMIAKRDASLRIWPSQRTPVDEPAQAPTGSKPEAMWRASRAATSFQVSHPWLCRGAAGTSSGASASAPSACLWVRSDPDTAHPSFPRYEVLLPDAAGTAEGAVWREAVMRRWVDTLLPEAAFGDVTAMEEAFAKVASASRGQWAYCSATKQHGIFSTVGRWYMYDSARSPNPKMAEFAVCDRYNLNDKLLLYPWLVAPTTGKDAATADVDAFADEAYCDKDPTARKDPLKALGLGAASIAAVETSTQGGATRLFVYLAFSNYIPIAPGAVFQLTTRAVDYNAAKVDTSLSDAMALDTLVLRAFFAPSLRRALPTVAGSGCWDPAVLTAALREVRLPKPFEVQKVHVDFAAHVASNPVTALWGPPGTGKTTTLAALLRSIADVCTASQPSEPVNILVVAGTHTALQQLHGRLGDVPGAFVQLVGRGEKPLALRGPVPSAARGRGRGRGAAAAAAAEPQANAPVYCNILFTTVWGASKLPAAGFDLLVLDEGSQIPVAHAVRASVCLRPQPHGGSPRLVVAGDPLQLPPILSVPSASCGMASAWTSAGMVAALGSGAGVLSESVMEALLRRASDGARITDLAALRTMTAADLECVIQLARSRRCVPALLPLLHATYADIATAMPPGLAATPALRKVVLTHNELEHEAVGRAVFNLLALPDVGSVGVVTPHRRQRARVQHEVDAETLARALDTLTPTDTAPPKPEPRIVVGTVETMQGDEFDAVVLAFADVDATSAFFLNLRRLNVALSRAQRYVVLVVRGGGGATKPGAADVTLEHAAATDAVDIARQAPLGGAGRSYCVAAAELLHTALDLSTHY